MKKREDMGEGKVGEPLHSQSGRLFQHSHSSPRKPKPPGEHSTSQLDTVTPTTDNPEAADRDCLK